MENRFKNVVGAAILSFEEFGDIMAEAFKNFGVETDDFDIAPDNWDTIGISYTGEESRKNFANNFGEFTDTSASYDEEDLEEDEENDYLSIVKEEDIPCMLSVLFGREISDCFMKEADEKACIVFKK